MLPSMDIARVYEQFPTQHDCISHLEQKRWGDKPICPYCRSDNTARYEHRHRCYTCETSFSVTVGTPFHNTHLPLQKWFLAISLILHANRNISAMQLSRDIKVNKNTAWRIRMQIQNAMAQRHQRTLLIDVVGMGETYVNC